jgi:GNAT superfamily N-acetyltransferase
MNQSEFEVREVEPSEARQLTQLAHLAKAYWGYSPQFMAAFDDELTIKPDDLKNERFLFRVGTCNGKICSFYALDRESEPKNTVEMTALFVEPTAIGKGYGKHLFEHSVELAKSLGVSSMMIHSDPYAEKFYTKMGAMKLKDIASRSVEGREIPLLEYKF